MPPAPGRGTVVEVNTGRSPATFSSPLQMERTRSAVLGGGVIVIALTIWLLYPRAAPAPKPDGGNYRFMHCPKCDKEYPYDARKVSQGCIRCGPEGVLVPTVDSIAGSGGRSSPFAWMIVPLLLEVTLLLAAVVYISRRPRGSAEEAYLHIRCLCRRKLRYSIRSVGRPGRCPGCKRSLVFPPAADEDSD
jgi:hypothetical protein